MSHYVCHHCGGQATWYKPCCWRCAGIAQAATETEAAEAAERIAKVFADALKRTPRKMRGNIFGYGSQ